MDLIAFQNVIVSNPRGICELGFTPSEEFVHRNSMVGKSRNLGISIGR